MTNSVSSELPTPLVSTEWLNEHLSDPGLRILDCSVVRNDHEDGSYSFSSGREGWQQAHIPGSIFVDVLTELSDPDHAVHLMMPAIDTFAEIMATHGVGDGTQVVLYDNSNHAWAARVWWMLRVCGFDNAAVLNGGWNKWTTERRGVSISTDSYPPAAFTTQARPELMASKQDVLDSIDNDNVSLINALSPQSHNGEVNLFSRPGRIPGSSNVYCQSLVDPETKMYIEKQQMQQLFQETGALDTKQVITYCGGGIAASSDALALTLLGVKNIAVYDGSMAEWTADPEAPLETDNTNINIDKKISSNNTNRRDTMTDEYYEKGMQLRRKMLGPEGADVKVENASDFIKPLEEWVTKQCFGEAWHRPVLDNKTRSMITIAMLVSMGQNYHVKNHVLGAIANGVTKEEIREILMHSIIYCGLPQAVHAFLAAEEVFKEMEQE